MPCSYRGATTSRRKLWHKDMATTNESDRESGTYASHVEERQYVQVCGPRSVVQVHALGNRLENLSRLKSTKVHENGWVEVARTDGVRYNGSSAEPINKNRTVYLESRMYI